MAGTTDSPRPHDDAELAGQAGELIELLKRQRVRRGPDDPPRKVSAIRLANALGVRRGGSLDSRKRGVRRIVRLLRDQGQPIMADLTGYWWGEYPRDHAAYRRHRRRQGLSHLAAESRDRRSDAAAASAGQLALFGG